MNNPSIKKVIPEIVGIIPDNTDNIDIIIENSDINTNILNNKKLCTKVTKPHQQNVSIILQIPNPSDDDL